MGSIHKPWAWMAAVAVSWGLAGCTGYNAITNEPTSPLAGKVVPVGGGPRKTPLGVAQTLKAFTVDLSTPQAPRTGKTLFAARIMRNGKPATQVMVDLSLSQSESQRIGPEGSMERTGPGIYSRVVHVPNAGAWLARVTVVGTNDTESFFFSFNAAK